jgi:hypothetical protein
MASQGFIFIKLLIHVFRPRPNNVSLLSDRLIFIISEHVSGAVTCVYREQQTSAASQVREHTGSRAYTMGFCDGTAGTVIL